ncbi:MAG: hypothetical protein WAN12_01440 [Candidatus Acidiferrum sp.]
MYIFTLVSDVKKVVEVLRVRYGDFKLAMLYNAALDVPTNWNLILASDWTDKLGITEATHLIARELHQCLSMENRSAVSRVTVLNTGDPFVRDMTRLYPVLTREGGVPVSHVTAGDVTDGAGFLIYSQPEIPA